MDREVGALVEAFRGELEGCHRFLDSAGCPRQAQDGRPLGLKDRIHILVLADHQYGDLVGDALVEVRTLKWLADQYDEFGRVLPQESRLPPLAQRIFDILADLQGRVDRRRKR